MTFRDDADRERQGDGLERLTKAWGSRDAVNLYLDRCQVDTPTDIVAQVWKQVHRRRRRVGSVVDFGAGDGRFAQGGRYQQYVGYEIDPARSSSIQLPTNARLHQACAFTDQVADADLCIGNPPYVRNQDLPVGWRHDASRTLEERTGVRLSGLANAWQYFFLLALASVKKDGMVALVIPYEWVSRPSVSALRNYITNNGWDVCVYRLNDSTFDRVLTTSSIAIVDKRKSSGRWEYFSAEHDGTFSQLNSVSGSSHGVLAYARRNASAPARAKRGLSPGTQQVLTLTEGERVRAGLRIGLDVVPCVTSLKPLPDTHTVFDANAFAASYRNVGRKCWLVRTDRKPSRRLIEYFMNIPRDKYQTATCLGRERWWEFSMPEVPAILVASGFVGGHPKAVVNAVGAHAVGSVYGVYGPSPTKSKFIVKTLRTLDLRDEIVSHAHGLRKIEVSQLNTVIAQLMSERF